MGHEWDQPGEDHGPVGPGQGELQGGKKRVSQPNTTVSFGGPPHPAMEAGRYDLSLTANQRFQAWCEAWSRECLRVLKPGGHLLASCGSRTYQRMACGVEDAGFEIRDSIMWLYGSGFPKSLDVSKAIDRAAGAEREVVGEEPDRWTQKGGVLNFATDRPQDSVPVTGAPATAEAAQWDGWGTALKPAHEPIVVARKPLIGTVAANVLEHGTGGINVAGCRIGTDEEIVTFDRVAGDRPRDQYRTGTGVNRREEVTDGRWPANVVLDQEAAAELDAQTGELQSGLIRSGSQREGLGYHGGLGNTVANDSYGDSGGASRFFYCAKTSRGERNAGLTSSSTPLLAAGATPQNAEDADWSERNGNHHPTVKPINLMRWLVRLVTPPGGTVLDPFTGSGSTGCAAVLEGFDFIGCEREAEYVAIAEARITFWAQHLGREVEDVLGLVGASEKARKRHEEMGHGSLFDLSLETAEMPERAA
jgi:site-specific DNA-methyltransferase (adenine-specific)